MNSTPNPKKDTLEKHPKYVSTGLKYLYVEILHEKKKVWVKVTGTDKDTVTGLIVKDLINNPLKLGKELTFNADEILPAQEFDYIEKE